MASSISLRVYTGASAGTESSAQSTITLTDADALTGGDVMPGTNSFERWVRLRIDSAPDVGVTNFWVEDTGNLPEGYVIMFGITDTPATPVATTSTVATNEFIPGRRFIFDVDQYDDVGDHTKYVVFQAQVADDATGGPIDMQSLEWGWQEA